MRYVMLHSQYKTQCSNAQQRHLSLSLLNAHTACPSPAPRPYPHGPKLLTLQREPLSLFCGHLEMSMHGDSCTPTHGDAIEQGNVRQP